MKILFIGDIVAKVGRKAIAEILPNLIKKRKLDFVIANAENSAGGSGITSKVAKELFFSGVNVLTSGDHIWKQRDILETIEKNDNILRPANLNPGCPGRGAFVYQVKGTEKIAVVNLQGRTFMDAIECPFRTADALIKDLKKQTKIIIVDFHAEATSEKIAMGHFLNGKVSAVLGTHTHVQTADEKILSEGTAYLTDAGMTGPCDSVIGRVKEDIIKRFTTGIPVKFRVAEGDVQLQGAIVQIDENTAKAISIERVIEKIK